MNLVDRRFLKHTFEGLWSCAKVVQRCHTLRCVQFWPTTLRQKMTTRGQKELGDQEGCSPKIAQGKMKGVLLGSLSGNTLFFALCYPIGKFTCLLIFSSFCALFLFATCHRRIHKMLKANLIGGNYGQLFLIDGPTEHALLNHPSARADFLPTLSSFGVGEVPYGWCRPPNETWPEESPVVAVSGQQCLPASKRCCHRLGFFEEDVEYWLVVWNMNFIVP